MFSNANDASSRDLFPLCRTSRYFSSNGFTADIEYQLCRLLSEGADPNFLFEDSTPLCEASRRGNEVIAEFLLYHGASIDLKDKTGNSPLHIAAYYGRVDVLGLLLNFGADINGKNGHGFSPILCALINGSYSGRDVVKVLIERGVQVNIVHKGEPFIKFLVSKGTDLEVLDLVLDAGASPHYHYNSLILDRKALDRLQGQRDWQIYVQKLVISGFKVSLMANIVFDMYMLGFDSLLDKPEVKDLLNYLQKIRTKVPRLEILCRTRIRHELVFSRTTEHIRQKIDRLPLPQSVKAFLKLDKL